MLSTVSQMPEPRPDLNRPQKYLQDLERWLSLHLYEEMLVTPAVFTAFDLLPVVCNPQVVAWSAVAAGTGCAAVSAWVNPDDRGPSVNLAGCCT
jgi:hypothetical protein